jgi:hypothetical protein
MPGTAGRRWFNRLDHRNKLLVVSPAAAAPDHAPAKCPEDTQLCHITEIRRIIVEPKYRIVDQKGDEIASGEEQDPKPPIMISPRPGLWIRDPTWHLQMLLGTMVLRRALPSVPQG